MARLRRQRLGRDVDSAPDVGPAARDDRGVEGVERLEERVVVERHRALDEGVAGERDEPDAVAREPVDEVANGELRALEARGLHVVGVHALGGVDDQQEVGPLPLERSPSASPSAAARAPRSPSRPRGSTTATRSQRRKRETRERPRDGAAPPRAARARVTSAARARTRSTARRVTATRPDQEPVGFSESHGHSPGRSSKARGESASPTGRAPRARERGRAPRTRRTARRAGVKPLIVRVVFSNRSMSA